MIFNILNHKEFSSVCLTAWHQNADFWDKTRTINSEVKQYISEHISNYDSKINLIDIGCGNGWLYKDIVRQKDKIAYCGIDHNQYFIKRLEKRYPNNLYYCCDFTQPLNERLLGKFDIVVSCLSLIEMSDIDAVFNNFRYVLSKGGVLVLITLNPYFEIIRLNEDYNNLKKDFTVFRADANPKYYKKEIVINGEKTGRFYYGVLHTTERLINAALKNGFSISKFKELNFSGGSINEPIYHAYTLNC